MARLFWKPKYCLSRSKYDIVAQMMQGLRCFACGVTLLSNDRKQKVVKNQKNRRREITIRDSHFNLLIAAKILEESFPEVFEHETPDSHRFTNITNISICSIDHLRAKLIILPT